MDQIGFLGMRRVVVVITYVIEAVAAAVFAALAAGIGLQIASLARTEPEVHAQSTTTWAHAGVLGLCAGLLTLDLLLRWQRRRSHSASTGDTPGPTTT